MDIVEMECVSGLVTCFIILLVCDRYIRHVESATTIKSDLECEFPPKNEVDLTHTRRKRLTTETGLVCLEDYPYTVSIRLHGKHWCGGAIIGKFWVLTAAQCFDYVTKEEVTVRIGSVFRDFGGRILAVSEIQRHPEYKMDQYYPEHNLAMVKVNVPIEYNNRIQAVALATANSGLPSLFGETIVTGYGSVVTGQIREGENQELRRMIVQEVPRAECRIVYGNDYHLQHDHMCLKSVMKGVALCAGDTGDPAVHFSGMNRAGTLYGIALFSGTEECAYKSKPGIFAKVAFSKKWIEKVLMGTTDPLESADSGENEIPFDVSAAKAAANGSKNRVQDVATQTGELFRKIREAFNELWQNELIIESRERVAAWTRDAVQRIRDGTPPLSPVLLYEELVALFKDRMWRRSVAIFTAGAVLGGGAGLMLGLRAASRPLGGPHARALIAQPDRAVLLVDDAVTPGAGPGEVLIRVQAFSVCARDRAVLRGRAASLRSLVAKSPLTIGRGFAGVVLDAGAGVPLELGDEVWGCLSEWSGGAAAELLTIRSSRVSRRPRGLAADAAAALPWAGTLALAALDKAPYEPEAWKGKRVAIIGATSGEGLALLQLLSRKGLGPQPPLPNDTRARFTSLIDRSERRVYRSTRRGLTHGSSADSLLAVFCASFYTYRALRWTVGLGSHTDWLERGQQLSPGLERLASLVDSGLLTPTLDKVYLPQDFEAALAHACSEDAVGTTVIRFP